LSSDLSTGLVVSGVGLLITFTALLIFIGVILALKAIFPYKEEAGEAEETAAPAVVSDDKDEELAAAIAAVLHLRKRRSSQLGSALTEGKSSFWTSD
jgi:sodium pump decarboxylase gamma subunit